MREYDDRLERSQQLDLMNNESDGNKRFILSSTNRESFYELMIKSIDRLINSDTSRLNVDYQYR